MSRIKNILFINPTEKECGVYQYGKRVFEILKHSKKYNFIYEEIKAHEEFYFSVVEHEPKAIIYNFHPLTMAWLNNEMIRILNTVTHLGFSHEGTDVISFDFFLNIDSTAIDTGRKFAVPRPLFENVNVKYSENIIPVISTFGFAFGDKGLGRIAKTVNEQFDKAIIRIHIPRAFYGDRNGEATAGVLPGIKNEITKEGIELRITDNFLSDKHLLQFLAESTINVFFYDEMKGRGLSSVIDYALSVNVPIAISKSDMFRHIYNTGPSICYEDRSLNEIIESGIEPLKQYRDLYSNKNLVNRFENILDKVL